MHKALGSIPNTASKHKSAHCIPSPDPTNQDRLPTQKARAHSGITVRFCRISQLPQELTWQHREPGRLVGEANGVACQAGVLACILS